MVGDYTLQRISRSILQPQPTGKRKRPWYIYIYIYIYIYFPQTTCESTFDTLSSSAANQGDNTVSVAQGCTATPSTIKQLMPPDRVFKRYIYIYIYIYIYARLTKSRDYIDVRSSSFLVQFVIFFKNVFTFGRWCHSKRFLMLCNHTGMVVQRAFHLCWNPFDTRHLFGSFSFSFIFFYASLHQGTPDKRHIILQENVICWLMGPLRWVVRITLFAPEKLWKIYNNEIRGLSVNHIYIYIYMIDW